VKQHGERLLPGKLSGPRKDRDGSKPEWRLSRPDLTELTFIRSGSPGAQRRNPVGRPPNEHARKPAFSGSRPDQGATPGADHRFDQRGLLHDEILADDAIHRSPSDDKHDVIRRRVIEGEHMDEDLSVARRRGYDP
jgi:hypothetical protein